MPTSFDLPLLVGRSPQLDLVVSEILSRGDDTEDKLFDNLCLLSDHVKVKVFFDKPIPIFINKTHGKNMTEAVIGKFFKSKAGRGYSVRHSHVRRGNFCTWVQDITRYEPVVEKKAATEGYKSLEAFTRKFDPRFISPEEIKKLYKGTSAQHGGKYTSKDFHKLGPRGKDVLKNFLWRFKGLNEDTEHYRISQFKNKDGSEYKVMDSYHRSSSHTGRDITIEHKLGRGFIHYASEYPGCLNGRYGILANMNEFLWLEDD